ncbi:MAG: HlyD family efflux transporter periplasmic adaptor subunit, partial [Leptolyngbyaceae cyanobacterium SM2_3_12]|nr:HlyD family efflux transporter periplasmic adaptor subunit [Leptolyngbyaceae cyanobacterium SM2_3_12]
MGAPVAISSNTDSRLQLQGTVQSIDPVVNAATRVAKVNLTLPPSDLLKPGMFLRGDISTSSRQGLTIPTTAILPPPRRQQPGVRAGRRQPGHRPPGRTRQPP